ncbi:MAG: DCC1-like thiol-disulfide oxidoreductase family protein, partial [Gemmatimonadota bacterium]
DDEGRFRFAPLHGDFATGIVARHPGLEGIDSLVLVKEGGSVAVRSDAVLGSMRLLGGAWRLLLVFALIPRPIRDWAYDLFAGWRYRLFGRYESCPVPPPDVRNRFLS